MEKNDTRKKKNSSGFTLIEILAALLLIGLVLPAVMKGISLTSLLVSDSDRRYEALDLAQSKMDEVLLEETWQSSASQSGRFDDEFDDYEWALDVSDWTESDVKEVNVYVYWDQRNRQEYIQLTTLVYDNGE